MINKVYSQVKQYIKENLVFFIIILVVGLLSWIRLPFFINAPGGLINLKDKITIENSYSSKGSLNMTYVSEYKCNIFMLIYAYFNPDWDIVKQEDYIYDNETLNDMVFRDKLLLQNAISSAVTLGYSKAGNDVSISNEKAYIIYKDELADTDLKVGDQVIEVEGKAVNGEADLRKIIDDNKNKNKIELKVINNKKNYTRYAKYIDIEGVKLLGVMISKTFDYEVDVPIKIKFGNNEQGPSGGLMTTLQIYDYLIKKDITNGYTISGTGTIDSNGNVGSIGGVKYKLKGAVKNKAKVFLVPIGENYDDAIRYKNENNYDIEVIGVSTFDEALEYLENLK